MKKFDRDQLVFVVDVMFMGVIDKIQGCLLPVNDNLKGTDEEKDIVNYVAGCRYTIGIQLPILYAQLTGDGMGTGEFPQFDVFERRVEKFKEIQWSATPGDGTFPDCRDLAEEFVDSFFSDYLTAN